MRNYNVYLYNECPIEQNSQSYPSYWIWKIENCLCDDSVPNGAIRMTLDELISYKQANKDTYNTWIQTKVSTCTMIDKKVKKAINGVNSVMSEFCAENIIMGITQAGKTKLIADALRDVFYYSQTGSLYEAKNALNAITIVEEMSPFLTENRRQEVITKIDDLLSTL